MKTRFQTLILGLYTKTNILDVTSVLKYNIKDGKIKFGTRGWENKSVRRVK